MIRSNYLRILKSLDKEKNYNDSENSEMSDNGILQFSGNTRWHKFDPIVIDEIETLQQKINKISKVLETVLNNGYAVSNILQHRKI